MNLDVTISNTRIDLLLHKVMHQITFTYNLNFGIVLDYFIFRYLQAMPERAKYYCRAKTEKFSSHGILKWE